MHFAEHKRLECRRRPCMDIGKVLQQRAMRRSIAGLCERETIQVSASEAAARMAANTAEKHAPLYSDYFWKLPTGRHAVLRPSACSHQVCRLHDDAAGLRMKVQHMHSCSNLSRCTVHAAECAA